MRIVLCYPAKEQHLQQIAAVAPEGAEIIDAGQERVAEEILSADIYCGHAKNKQKPIAWEEVVAAGRLKWIQSSAAGMDHCLTPPVIASDILVSSASGVLANQVADHTFALMCGALRDLPTFFRAQQRKEFIRRPTRDLHGATVGIVGFGGNGRRLAEVLHPFKTRILATDCYPIDKPDYVDQLLPADELDTMLPQLDVLIITAPLNEETHGMFDRRRIGLLPEGAVLVNVARGPLVVEEGLVDALTTGCLGAAAVDVTEVEPLPVESRLWDLPNMIITPHVGGQCATRLDDMTRLFCQNLQRYQQGETPVNLVEKRLGFPKPEHALWRIGQAQ